MVIDAHQHFWRYNESEYVWMDERMDVLKQDRTPADLYPLLKKAGVDGTVAVQARQMETETTYLLDIAGQHDWVMGVVGWFDFHAPRLEARIEQAASDDKLKGARELVHDMPDTEYAVSAEHVVAVGVLEKYGVSYDLLLKPEHIEPATRLVDRYPNQSFVVDHIAKPNIASGEISTWKERIVEIARRENVFCKLSGMVTEAAWEEWSPTDFYPYVEICLEAFGSHRLMFGSDWPVCTLSGSYVEVVDIVRGYVKTLGEAEQRAILGETCAAFYRL